MKILLFFRPVWYDKGTAGFDGLGWPVQKERKRSMKRKWKLAALLLCVAMVLGACGQTGQKTGKGLPDFMSFDYNYKDYLELGDYQGVSYTPYSTEVTEEEINKQIETYQKQKQTVEKTDKTVIENGDVVHIVFTGYLDGEAFEGGASGEDGADLEIGSGSFVGNFEEQLIGKEVGQNVTLENVVFPDDYALNKDLAGKSTNFEVSIQYIGKYVTPELNDEFAASLNFTDVSTMDQLKAYVENSLKETKESEKENKDYSAVVAAVLKNCTIKGYPQEAVDAYKNNMVSYYQNYASMYGIDFGTFLQLMLGMDEEGFNSQVEEASKQSVANEMLLTAIADMEGMTLSDEEYQQGLERYAEQNNTTVDALKSNNDENDMKTQMVFDKVLELLMAEAKAQ